MAVFPPPFLKFRSEGDAHSMAQTQAHQLAQAAREQRGKGHGDAVWGQGGINWSRRPRTLLCIWERNQPTSGLQEALSWFWLG